MKIFFLLFLKKSSARDWIDKMSLANIQANFQEMK